MQHFTMILTAGVLAAALGAAPQPAQAGNDDPILRLFNSLVIDGQRAARGEFRGRGWNYDDDDGYRRGRNDDDDDGRRRGRGWDDDDDDGWRGNDDDD